MSLKEHEKFWAFIALLVCIIAVSLPSLIGSVADVKLTLADKIVTGLIGVLGTVAGALFSRNADKLADTVQQMAAQQTTPQPVKVVNKAAEPVPVETPSEPAEELPDYAR
jgi:hypothetical protein